MLAMTIEVVEGWADSGSAADSSSISTSTAPEGRGSGEDEERYNRIVRSANRLLTSGQINQFEYKTLIASGPYHELTTEKVEAFTRAEGSFGEPWESRKQQPTLPRVARGHLIDTLRAACAGSGFGGRGSGPQATATDQSQEGGLLGYRHPASGCGGRAHGITLPQAAQAQTPEPSLTSLHLPPPLRKAVPQPGQASTPLRQQAHRTGRVGGVLKCGLGSG